MICFRIQIQAQTTEACLNPESALLERLITGSSFTHSHRGRGQVSSFNYDEALRADRGKMGARLRFN
jgi:hypothetical protein